MINRLIKVRRISSRIKWLLISTSPMKSISKTLVLDVLSSSFEKIHKNLSYKFRQSKKLLRLSKKEVDELRLKISQLESREKDWIKKEEEWKRKEEEWSKKETAWANELEEIKKVKKVKVEENKILQRNTKPLENEKKSINNKEDDKVIIEWWETFIIELKDQKKNLEIEKANCEEELKKVKEKQESLEMKSIKKNDYMEIENKAKSDAWWDEEAKKIITQNKENKIKVLKIKEEEETKSASFWENEEIRIQNEIEDIKTKRRLQSEGINVNLLEKKKGYVKKTKEHEEWWLFRINNLLQSWGHKYKNCFICKKQCENEEWRCTKCEDIRCGKCRDLKNLTHCENYHNQLLKKLKELNMVREKKKEKS